MKKIFTIAILALSINAFAQIPTNGLIGYWPFNGNANDESGNGNNGIVNGATLSFDRFGNENSAYSFNASNQNHITINSTFGNFGPSNFTVSAWVKKNLSSGTIFSKRNNGNRHGKWWEFDFGYFDVNESYNNHSSLLINNDDTLRNNTWYHFVGVRDGNTIKYYVNGNLYGTNTTPSIQDIINTDNAEIGCWFYAGTPWGCFDGLIDDIRIYDRALLSYEIASLYNEGFCFQTITVTDTLIINANLTGFNPVAYANTIKVYPNPTKDAITIDCGNNFSTLNGYTIKITNSLSQTVYTSLVKQQSTTINLNSWTGKGIYFVHLIDANSNTIDIKKIVLQ